MTDRDVTGRPPTPDVPATGRMPVPAITALLVNWNGGDLVLRAIESLRVSAGPLPLQILVFDNASTDGSPQRIASRFPEVELTRSADNIGFVRANNRLLPGARAGAVLLLNPDAVPDGDAIQRLHALLMTKPDVGACGPRLLLADGRLDPACRRRFKTISTYFYRLLFLDRLFPSSPRFGRYTMGDVDPAVPAQIDVLSGACMLVRRSALEDIGLFFDERFHMYCEDEDWCRRLADAGWRILYEPAAVVWHVKGGSSRGVSRWTPVRTSYHWHRSVGLFHRKHLARAYPLPVNLLVYAAVFCVGALSVLKLAVLALVSMVVPARSRAAARAEGGGSSVEEAMMSPGPAALPSDDRS